MVESKILSFCILYFINTISIANRYGHVSVQPELAQRFEVGESEIGGIMSIFYIPFVLSCLVYGYLGDRYNRKIILIIATYIQAAGVLCCSLSTNMHMFYASKILIGVTQSAFITIAPTILSDIYTEAERTKMIGIYYTAGAVGAGVGIIGMGIIASKINMVFAFTSFAIATAALTTLYLVFVPNYERGASEKKSGDGNPETEKMTDSKLEMSNGGNSSIKSDVLYLLKNKTYIYAIFAYAATSAVSETSLVWYQELLRRLMIVKNEHPTCIEDFYLVDAAKNLTIGGSTICGGESDPKEINCENCNSATISTYFGLISIFCGMAGTMAGIIIVQKMIGKVRNAGPLVASVGQFLAGASIILLIMFCRNMGMEFVWVFTALIFMFVTSCFGILADLVARVVVSEKRSLAYSIQNFVARAVGASFPPLMAGYITETKLKTAVADWSVPGNFSVDAGSESNETLLSETLDDVYKEERFDAMRMGFFVIPTYAFISCLLWYMTSRTFVKDEDKRRAAVER